MLCCWPNFWVKAAKTMRDPAIEPGSVPWQGTILPLNQPRWSCTATHFCYIQNWCCCDCAACSKQDTAIGHPLCRETLVWVRVSDINHTCRCRWCSHTRAGVQSARRPTGPIVCNQVHVLTTWRVRLCRWKGAVECAVRWDIEQYTGQNCWMMMLYCFDIQRSATWRKAAVQTWHNRTFGAGNAVVSLQQEEAPGLTCTTDDGSVIHCAAQPSSQSAQQAEHTTFGMQCNTPGGVSVQLTAAGQVSTKHRTCLSGLLWFSNTVCRPSSKQTDHIWPDQRSVCLHQASCHVFLEVFNTSTPAVVCCLCSTFDRINGVMTGPGHHGASQDINPSHALWQGGGNPWGPPLSWWHWGPHPRQSAYMAFSAQLWRGCASLPVSHHAQQLLHDSMSWHLLGSQGFLTNTCAGLCAGREISPPALNCKA